MQILILIFLAIGLPLGLVFFYDIAWQWIILGAAAWAVALVIKVVLGWAVNAFSQKLFTNEKIKSAIWGAWSAICELGIAAIIFIKTSSTLANVIGFGVGVGIIEIIYVVSQLIVKKPPKSESQKGFMKWSLAIERLLTLIGHVSSRGLIWIGIKSWFLSPFLLIALLLFSIVDGVATYGTASEWNWSDSRLYKRFLGFVAVMGAIELILFLVGILLIK